jgi:Winged helix DNA-binding domain
MALRSAGVPVPGGQAQPHLLIFAACSGVITRGPDLGSEPSYVLTAAPPAESAELRGPVAMRTLARRYLAAFGPAAAEDFTAWSGQPARACATALDSLTGPGPGGQWQLLSAFDTYLVGCRQRDLLIDPAEAKFIYAGGGWIHPSVVRDGRIAGSWRLRQRPGSPE